jgi:hypothetical protein
MKRTLSTFLSSPYREILLNNKPRFGLHHLEIRVKIGYFVIASTYIATELSILLGCQPFRKNWQIFPDPGSTYSSRLELLSYIRYVLLR